MAKQFYTTGTGSQQTLTQSQDDKIPIYDSLVDAQADLANIEEGAIVATKDSGATEKVVDVVQDGNMNAVTSNAVADFTAYMFTAHRGTGATIAEAFDNAGVSKDNLQIYGVCGNIANSLIPAMSDSTIGLYNITNGGPSFGCIVQKQFNNYYSAFIFSYSSTSLYLFRFTGSDYHIQVMN